MRWEHRHSNGRLGRAARTQLARARRRQTRRRFSPAETKTLTVVLPIDLNVEAWASINELTVDQQIPRLPEHALGQKTGNNDAKSKARKISSGIFANGEGRPV